MNALYMKCPTCGAVLLREFVRRIGMCPCGARVELKEPKDKATT